jgi:hypothetical protein
MDSVYRSAHLVSLRSRRNVSLQKAYLCRNSLDTRTRSGSSTMRNIFEDSGDCCCTSDRDLFQNRRIYLALVDVLGFCTVRMNGTLSGPGVHRRSGHHHWTHRHRDRHHRERPVERGVQTDTGDIDVGSTVLPTNSRGTDGLRASTVDYRPTAADYTPPNEAVPALAVRPYQARTTDTDSEERA